MYRCELCGKTAPPHTPAHKITVGTRRVTYPLRPKVFACWKWRGDRRKFVRPDDRGGVGRQISREVTACPDCARRAEEQIEGHEPDAEGRGGALPRALTNYGGGRAPPPVSLSPVAEPVGTLMPLGEFAVGFFEHPKLIELKTGRIIHRWEELAGGRQNSSIIRGQEAQIPATALDPANRRFAVAGADAITVIQLG